jgi:6-phosphogluconate dehydrogenase
VPAPHRIGLLCRERVVEMKLAMIGLGRMGGNLSRRLMRGGHECVVYDLNRDAVAQLEHEGAIGAATLDDLAGKLASPRVVWVMVPASFTDSVIDELTDVLGRRRHRHRRRQRLLPR